MSKTHKNDRENFSGLHYYNITALEKIEKVNSTASRKRENSAIRAII